jgi:spore germination protein KC
MRLMKIILMCLAVLLFTGCWDRVEVEEMAYVMAIGIDKGKGDHYNITYQIANPQVGTTQSAESQNEPASEIITVVAPGVISARDTANVSVSRRITFSHTKLLIVSEELAKSEKFPNIIYSLLRDTEIRRTISILVSRENASEFLRGNSPKLETRPHKFYDFMLRRWQETGLAPTPTLSRFVARTEGRSGLFLAIYATTKVQEHGKLGNEDEYIAGEVNISGGNPTEVIGSAVFKDGVMIDTLTGEETRISLNLRPAGRPRGILSTFPDPLNEEFKITARVVVGGKAKVKMNLNGDHPLINVTVPFNVEILAIPSLQDYVENLDNQNLLQQHIEKGLTKKITTLIEKTQKKYKGDPFLWSSYARMKFLTYDDFENYDWMSKYSKADIDINVKVTIVGFGKETRPTEFMK